MSITFACESCGKSFTLEDRFAGKKGRCKGCGEIMLIPSPALVSESLAGHSPPKRSASRTVARTPEPEDVYGFDEAPLPPRSAPPVRAEGDPGTKPGPDLKKKKKKARGFFGGGKAKSSSSNHSFPIDLSSGLSRTVIGLIFTFVILPAIYGVVNGLTPRSGIESYYRKQIAMLDEVNGLLKKVHDVESADQSSATINAKIRAVTKYTRENMALKGRKNDINALTEKYKPEQDRVNQALLAEFGRLGSIPGVMEALHLEAAIAEAGAVEVELQRLREKNNELGIQ